MSGAQNFGLSDKIADAFTKKYPAAYLTDKLAQAEALVDAQNPAGWLRKAIEDDYQPPESTSSRKEKKIALETAERAKVAEQVRERFHKNSSPEPIGEDGLTTETAWNQTSAPGF